MESAYFHIIYEGPALENNEMDVRDLAPCLLALSDVIEEANNILNHKKVKVVVNVKASFKTGCFGVDLAVAQNVVDNFLSLFKEPDIVTASLILSLLGINAKEGMVGLIKLLKWIKGRKIKTIKTLENGRKKIIVDDDSIEVEKEITELLKSYNLRKSLEQTIFVPLDKEGIESITTVEDPQQKEKAVVTISKEERIFFATPEQEEEKIEEKIYETSLQLISPVFQEKNKWRFTEGASPFFADIKDEGFINSVQKGDISFSSGDVLTVRLHKHQYLQEGKIKADYEVLKILHHRTTAQQIKLPFDES